MTRKQQKSKQLCLSLPVDQAVQLEELAQVYGGKQCAASIAVMRLYDFTVYFKRSKTMVYAHREESNYTEVKLSLPPAAHAVFIEMVDNSITHIKRDVMAKAISHLYINSKKWR